MKTYDDLLIEDWDAVDEIEDILAPFEALWNAAAVSSENA